MHPLTISGRRYGFGGCSVCHGTYNWCVHFSISFDRGTGGFPTCVDCALVLTINELITECRELWRSWNDGRDTKENEAYARACLEVWDREGRTANEATTPVPQKDWSPRKRRAMN